MGKFLFVILTIGSVRGWGALFNRFSPALIPAEKQTGSYYNLYTDSKHNVEEPRMLARKLENLVSNEVKAAGESDPCFEKKCTSNENCCDGSVCIDIDLQVSVGTCMPLYGRKEGERCMRNSDCESGYVCLDSEDGMMCQELVPGVGRFGDECRESDDCNIHLGLCCRLQRRQKMQPKKLCTYFTASDVCIGPVEHTKVRRTLEYSSNEKRRSPHPDHEFANY
jgi:hypothetical protein